MCYGNLFLNATQQPSVSNLVFEQPGDVVNVADIQALNMSALDTRKNVWGVALMKLQANVRVAPTTSAGIISGLAVDDVFAADGRNTDSTWVHIRTAGGTSGWVYSDLLTADGDIDVLNVIVAGEIEHVLNPMQAFYFKTGLGGDSTCSEAPISGVLIQTPSGAWRVNLRVNGVDITLGSTAFLIAQPGDNMTMTVVEGIGTMAAAGETVIVPAGAKSSVALDENAEADGAPEPAQPYTAETLTDLPLSVLPETITIAQPLSPDEIAVAAMEFESQGMVNTGGVVQPNLTPGIVGFNMSTFGMSEHCAALMSQLVNVTSTTDIALMESLATQFENDGCIEETERIAQQLEDASGDIYDEEIEDGGGE